jgi:hypothetical protein
MKKLIIQSFVIIILYFVVGLVQGLVALGAL